MLFVVSGLFVGRIMAYLCPFPLMILYYLWGPNLHPSMVAKIGKISHGWRRAGELLLSTIDKLGKFFERHNMKAVILGPLAGPLYASQGKAMGGLIVFFTMLLTGDPFLTIAGCVAIPLFLTGYFKMPAKCNTLLERVEK
jgi:hypothetical protein